MLMTWQHYGAMVKVCISVLTYYAWWLWIKIISWHSMYVHVHKGSLWNIASVFGMGLWNYRNKIMRYNVPVPCLSCSDFYVRHNQTPPPRKEIRIAVVKCCVGSLSKWLPMFSVYQWTAGGQCDVSCIIYNFFTNHRPQGWNVGGKYYTLNFDYEDQQHNCIPRRHNSASFQNGHYAAQQTLNTSAIPWQSGYLL